MASYLSDDWIAAYAAAGADLPECPGADAVIQYEVSGAPDGKVRWHEVIERGVITSAAVGKHADPDVSITWKVDEARRLLAGDIDAEVSFMEGGTKVEGDYVRWLIDLAPMRSSDAYTRFREAMVAATD